MVIFGIIHGVVIQLNVSNSSTNGTKNITNTKITIPIIMARYEYKITSLVLWLQQSNSQQE